MANNFENLWRFEDIENCNIQYPFYIRKLDKKNHWTPPECNDINALKDECIDKIIEKVFNSHIHTYSLWYLSNDEEFYCFVASVLSNANPILRNVDFLLISQEDLDKVGILPKFSREGNCLAVEGLHFNAYIDLAIAKNLVKELKKKEVKAHRCKKKDTEKILNYQKNKQCKAILKKSTQLCLCED